MPKILKIVFAVIFLSQPLTALAWQESGFKLPKAARLKAQLKPDQYEVLFNGKPEVPFHNDYWSKPDEGLYVDVVSGEPLFTSFYKYDAGAGLPTFTKPVSHLSLKQNPRTNLPDEKIPLVTRLTHLKVGYVVRDGSSPDGMTYTIYSSALRFVPKDKLKESGYAEFVKEFGRSHRQGD